MAKSIETMTVEELVFGAMVAMAAAALNESSGKVADEIAQEARELNAKMARWGFQTDDDSDANLKTVTRFDEVFGW